jgi:hypothetical protein
VALGVVGEKLVGALVGGPEDTVGAHVDAVNIDRRARAELPLIQKLVVFVEYLQTGVGAVADVNAPMVGSTAGPCTLLR